jgi:hypothetical protein
VRGLGTGDCRMMRLKLLNLPGENFPADDRETVLVEPFLRGPCAFCMVVCCGSIEIFLFILCTYGCMASWAQI